MILTVVNAAIAGILAMLLATSLQRIQPMFPVFYTLAAGAAVVSAYLLYIRARAINDERMRWMAVAYALAACAMIAQIANLPAFSQFNDRLRYTTSSISWLYLIWHAIIPTCALLAVMHLRRPQLWRAGVALLSLIATVYISLDVGFLPLVTTSDQDFTVLMSTLLPILATYSLVATISWIVKGGRRPSWPEAWLSVSLALGTWDILLHVFAGERYSPFWWASLTMRMAQFTVLAAGLMAGFAAFYHALDRYATILTDRLNEELQFVREGQSSVATSQRSEVLTRIQRMLAERALTAVFQPIVDLNRGIIVGVEALTRFPGQPQRPPNLWFEDAVSVGLGVELELLAIETAMARLPELPPDVYLSLNVSPQTIVSPTFTERFAQIPGHRIVIELTEHAEVTNYPELLAVITTLRTHGIRLAIDDVGAGFSNLRHVLRLEPEIIKLDLGLTHSIDQDPVRQALASSLIVFAKETHATLVAEGIEFEREYAMLLELGVECGQGYHIARPGPLPLAPIHGIKAVKSRELESKSPAIHVPRSDAPDAMTPAPAGQRWPTPTAGMLTVLGMLIASWYLVGLPAGFPKTVVADLLFSMTSGTAALLCFLTARRVKDAAPWWFFGSSCLAWFLGMMVWNVYELAWRVTVPYPSLADVGFLLFYPLFATGALLLLWKRPQRPRAIALILDFLVLFTVVTVVLMELLLEPLLDAPDHNSLPFFTSLCWLVGTFVLIYLVVTLIVWNEHRSENRSMQIMLAGLGCLAVGNVVYSRLALTGSYYVGHPIDLGWHIGFLLIAIAARYSNNTVTTHLRVLDLRASWRLRAAFVVAGTLSLSGLATYHLLLPVADWHVALGVGSAGVFLAARLGYAGLQTDWLIKTTTERDRMNALIEASVSIASSVDIQNVLEDVSRYATRTLGCRRAEVYIYDEQHTRVVASATSGITAAEHAVLQRLVDLPVDMLPAERTVLATRQPVIQWIDDPDIPEDVRSWLRSIGKIQALVTPLIAHGEVIGILDFWSPGTHHQFDSHDVSAALAIGQEAGLAIDNMRLMSMLRERADQDGLTGLLNHRALLGVLDHELMVARQTDTPLTIIMVDLNDFKTVNDRFGHLAGDRVLIEVAQNLQRCVRDCDHIGRYGGDEFLLVLPGCDVDEAEAVTARLAEGVNSQMLLSEDVAIAIDVAMGAAHFPCDGTSRAELILLADASMYALKAAQKIKER